MRDLRVAIVVLATLLAVAAKVLRGTGGAPDWLRSALGWLPSFGYGLGVPLLAASLPAIARRPRRTRWSVYLAGILGMVVAELTQRWERGRTLAGADIVALLIGAAIALALEAWCERREAEETRAFRA